MNSLREPDAGNPHVQFDEGETQTVIGHAPLIPFVSPYSTIL